MALSRNRTDYLSLCNRYERLVQSADRSGYRCEWEWTSELHAPKHVPMLSRWLLRRALDDHPIRFLPELATISSAPAVSFLIGHRGLDRLPQLLLTLQSIAGQTKVPVECIVVEQDETPKIVGHLPGWVRYVHSRPPSSTMPYCRSWALNSAARLARGRTLVLHDGDMAVPMDYATEIQKRVAEGHDAINLKRFVFYLDRQQTASVLDGKQVLSSVSAPAVVQNLEAGGSVAITSEAFDAIGGMDEEFVGWGGEDNEFWERCQVRSVWPYGYLSLVHLWHETQPRKGDPSNPALIRHRELSRVAVDSRIRRLKAKESGAPAGPAEWKGVS
jgi:hypothetical protein